MPFHHQQTGSGHWCRDRNDTEEFGRACSWLTAGLQPQRDDGGFGARGAGAELVTVDHRHC